MKTGENLPPALAGLALGPKELAATLRYLATVVDETLPDDMRWGLVMGEDVLKRIEAKCVRVRTAALGDDLAGVNAGLSAIIFRAAVGMASLDKLNEAGKALLAAAEE